jgi:GntR family transcriptional regulator
MLIDIHPDSPVPIYEQIVSQVLFSIASGSLAVGERVPSVRDLALQLMVNPNTVARAYQKLEERGVLRARRGLGMEVTPEAVAISRELRREIVQGRIREALREAVLSGVPRPDIRRLVEEELNRVNGKR